MVSQVDGSYEGYRAVQEAAQVDFDKAVSDARQAYADASVRYALVRNAIIERVQADYMAACAPFLAAIELAEAAAQPAYDAMVQPAYSAYVAATTPATELGVKQ